MLIQFQFQYLSIIKLKLELSAIEARVVLMDDAVVIRTYDNDIGRVVVLRTSEIVNMMCFNNAVAIFVAYSLATYLIAIVIELFERKNDAAVNLAILYQLLFLLYRSILVCHEELVIITLLIYLLRHGTQPFRYLLILYISATFHAEHICTRR